DAAERHTFFDALVDDFSPDPQDVARAVEAYRLDASDLTLRRLQNVVESPRLELFRRFNMAPDGLGLLLTMRSDLIGGPLVDHPRWSCIESDLKFLLRSCFSPGFLVLKRIDWRPPAVVLERLIQYEAVHQIQGWSDLHRRLADDRRCFGLFHPGLPDEPLIF